MEGNEQVDNHEGVCVVCDLSAPVVIVELLVVLSTLVNAARAKDLGIWLALFAKTYTFIQRDLLLALVTS